MKRSVFCALILVIAGLLMTPQTHAQNPSASKPSEPTSQCLDPTQPLEALTGTWAFNTAGSVRLFDHGGHDSGSNDLEIPVASAGSFVASIDKGSKDKPTGVLAITITSSRNGEIIQEKADGSYEVFPDCSGGKMTFNLSSGPISHDFGLGCDAGFSSLFFVGSDSGSIVWGTGRGGSGCSGATGRSCTGPNGDKCFCSTGCKAVAGDGCCCTADPGC